MLGLLAGRYSVDLVCVEPLVPFSESFGMTRAVGKSLRDRDALSG